METISHISAYHISMATELDILPLTEMINISYRTETAGAWTTEAHLFDGGKRTDAAELLATMSDPQNHIFKMENDKGYIIGTVCLTMRETDIYLGMLAVNPKMQGQGVGRQLMEASIAFAKKHHKNKITISVISERAELIAWYERFGFQNTGKKMPFPEEHILSKPLHTLEFSIFQLDVSALL